MAKLTLQFGEHVLKEVAVGSRGVRIGRLPDNALMIDNPAVSGHHARVFQDGDYFIVEDQNSTNGTFIDDQRVTRQPLKHGDVIVVGKHRITFDQFASDAEEVADQDSGGGKDLEGATMYLDTKQQRALLAKMGIQAPTGQGPSTAQRGQAPTTAKITVGADGSVQPAPAPAAPKVGVLRVLAGKTDRQEYTLEGHTTLIGKAATATVKLQGWFKPNVAVSISRKGDAYTASKLGGSPTINHAPLAGRHEMKDGDIIQVSGVTLEFHMK